MQTEPSSDGGVREEYQRQMLAIRRAFEQGATGAETLAARTAAVDGLVRGLWQEAVAEEPRLGKSVALVAIGGYGRGELYPYSDIDLLFLLDSKAAEKDLKDPIRRMSQALWDCGLRVSPTARRLDECDRFDPKNVESALALLDHRLIEAEAGSGGASLFERLSGQVLPKLVERERAAIARGLADLTALRHSRYGGTLFHLEPNVKEYPGGLRDVHVCGWMARLSGWRGRGRAGLADAGEFEEAVAFLERVRCYLHYRHERDDNTLDWAAQDAAAAIGLGAGRVGRAGGRGQGGGCGLLDAVLLSACAGGGPANGTISGGAGSAGGGGVGGAEPAGAAGGEGEAKNEAPRGAGYRVEQGVVTLERRWVRLGAARSGA